MAQGPESTRAKIQKRKPAGPSGGQGQRTWISKPPPKTATAREPSQVKDVKSNADRARSESYQHSKPYRQQILATYKEQPTKQRSEIAHHATGAPLGGIAKYHMQAIARNQELARSQATKDTKGNADYFRGRADARAQRAKTEAAQSHKELVALAREIITKHRDTPLPGVTGDTKTSLERVTADAYKMTPEFAQDFSTAANAGVEYQAGQAKAAEDKKYGGFMGAAAGILVGKGPIAGAARSASQAINSGVTSVAKKVPAEAALVPGLAIATGIAKVAPETAGAAAGELVDIPANAIPSLYYALEPTVHGHPETTAKRFVDPYVKLAKDPIGQAKTHPLGTALMVGGPLRGGNRLAGRGANIVKGTPNLPRAFVPGTSLEQVRRAPAGIIGQRKARQETSKPHMSEDNIRKTIRESFDAAQNQVRRESEAAISLHYETIKANGGKITRDVRKKSIPLSQRAASIVRARTNSEIIDQVAVRAAKGKKLGTKGTHNISTGRFGNVGQFKTDKAAQDFIMHRYFPHPMEEIFDKHTNTWKVVPAVAKDEMERFGIGKELPRPGPGARAAQSVVSSFRRAVLGTSLKWLTGNAVEAAVRATVNQVGPRSFYTGFKAYNFAKSNWTNKEFEEFQSRALGTGHYGMQLELKMHTDPKSFEGSKVWYPIAVGLDALHHGKISPVRPAYSVWQGWTKLAFPVLNGHLETGVRIGMLGKALRDAPLMNGHIVKLHDTAIKQAVDGMRNTPEMVQLGREVDRMFGQYGKFTPDERKLIAHYTPFLAWYMNAARFVVSNLPHDHPVASAVIASAHQTSEEWRKDKGLAMFMGAAGIPKGAVPLWLQGSVPVGNSKLRASRYTPFGLWSDPSSIAGTVLPLAEGSLSNIAGKDWKGDDLPTNINQNPYLRGVIAAMNFAEGTVPFTGIAARLSGTQDKILGTKQSQELSFKDRALKELPTTPVKPKPATSAKSFDLLSGSQKSKNKDPLAGGKRTKSQDPLAP